MSYGTSSPSLVITRLHLGSTRSSAAWCQRAPSSAAVSASLRPRTRWGLNGWSTLIDRLMNLSSGARTVMSRRSEASARSANSVSRPATPPPAISTRARAGSGDEGWLDTRSRSTRAAGRREGPELALDAVEQLVVGVAERLDALALEL